MSEEIIFEGTPEYVQPEPAENAMNFALAKPSVFTAHGVSLSGYERSFTYPDMNGVETTEVLLHLESIGLQGPGIVNVMLDKMHVTLFRKAQLDQFIAWADPVVDEPVSEDTPFEDIPNEPIV